MAKDPTKDTPPEGGQDVPAPSFPPIGEDEAPNFLGDFKTREEAEAWVKDVKPKLDQFETFQTEAREREQRFQDTINRLIAGQPAQQQNLTQNDSLEQRIKALPDPVEKPEDFQRSLVDLVKGAVTQTQTEQQRRDQFNALDRAFKGKYQNLAKYDSVIQDVAARETRALAARGGDPVAAIFADQDGFMERVARGVKETVKTWGIDPDATDSNQQQQQTVNRTAGIPGGTATAPGGANGATPPSSFVKELKEAQLKSGFY